MNECTCGGGHDGTPDVDAYEEAQTKYRELRDVIMLKIEEQLASNNFENVYVLTQALGQIAIY
jgi:hypothetical protein